MKNESTRLHMRASPSVPIQNFACSVTIQEFGQARDRAQPRLLVKRADPRTANVSRYLRIEPRTSCSYRNAPTTPVFFLAVEQAANQIQHPVSRCPAISGLRASDGGFCHPGSAGKRRRIA